MQLTSTIFTLALALSATAVPNNINKRFRGGWCGLHATQYQKNEGPGADTSVYRFSIDLVDADGAQLGSCKLVGAPTGEIETIGSNLPVNDFTYWDGAVDDDPVHFGYNGQKWDSSSSQCSVGDYDGGKREMDCGFSC